MDVTQNTALLHELMYVAIVFAAIATPFAVRELRIERKLRHQAVLQASIDKFLETRPLKTIPWPTRTTKITDKRRRTKALPPYLTQLSAPMPLPDQLVEVPLYPPRDEIASTS